MNTIKIGNADDDSDDEFSMDVEGSIIDEDDDTIERSEIDVAFDAVTIDVATDHDGTTAASDDDSDEDDTAVDFASEMRKVDLDERKAVDTFFQNGCGCTLYNGKPCYTAFTREHICSIRDQCSSFDRHDRYNVLFGHVMATVQRSEQVHRNGCPCVDRSQIVGEFLHEGMKVPVRLCKIKILPLFYRSVELHSSSCTTSEGRCTRGPRRST